MTSTSFADAIPDGTYRARAARAGMGKVEFQDGDTIHYIWISFSILDPPYEGRLYEWRGWLTNGAIYDAVPALLACGARLMDNDPSDLEGIDQYTVKLSIKTMECIEAPGIAKTYIELVERSDPF